MSGPKDGGPAFPVVSGMHVGCLKGECCRVSEGLSLRDWFAGQALVGLLANETTGKEIAPVDCVEGAYVLADAMLAERAKGGGQ